MIYESYVIDHEGREYIVRMRAKDPQPPVPLGDRIAEIILISVIAFACGALVFSIIPAVFQGLTQ